MYAPRLKTERVSYHEAVEEIEVEVDLEHLSLAIANLVINAADALATSAQKRIEVSALLEEDKVRLAVRDTGAGIAPEVKEHLFEPFFTTKAEGTGLGLAIAREIALAHRGELRAENRPGGGAVFTLTLPVPEVAAAGGTRR